MTKFKPIGVIKHHLIQIEVAIKNGILSPEQIKEARKKVPPEYKVKIDDPNIRIDNGIAKIMFRCSKIGKPSKVVT